MVIPTAVKPISLLPEIAGKVTDARITFLTVIGTVFLFTRRNGNDFNIPKLCHRLVFRAESFHYLCELTDVINVPA